MGGSIDDYEELGVVGKGNFGAVYLVRRRSNGARLVLKQLLSDGDFTVGGCTS
jgi:serine/threonine protein kinase